MFRPGCVVDCDIWVIMDCMDSVMWVYDRRDGSTMFVCLI